ncbi:hypothetical protein ASH00_15905 [Arthrobacter sp. Soil782]|uniref:hypothetical protein n=1 Tax=Arthrobacter sp. Soil782 TaxID=1736410 RepID=UPI000715EA3F|nr:hypothetical protein [Arthrobacter sp. Soil782]KRF03269.1 hypothetical protein ASH00_15905 [Arthrobacter sp. Soil782]
MSERSGGLDATVITGARGIGKTVMLGAAEDLARGRGWGVISETATQRLAGRLQEWIPRHAEPMGRVITVDEIHAVNRRELIQIGADLENLANDGQHVALVVAGLPALVDELLSDESAAFLRSADRIVLRNVPVDDVEESFARTFAGGGFETPAKALRQAAEATEGYPYLIQLVGYHLWREAGDGHGLTAATAARAIGRAQARIARTDLT